MLKKASIFRKCIVAMRCNIFLTLFTIISTLLIFYGNYFDFLGLSTFSLKDFFKLSLSLLATILGVIFVLLEVHEKRAMFFVGIISSACSLIYLVFWSPLLWDIAIKFVYIFLSFYGLYYWKNPHKRTKNKQKHLITRTLSFNEKFLYLVIAILGITILSYVGIFFGKYNSSLQAVSDAVTTVLSILGQWFMSRKYLEMWYMWIFVNAISIPLYLSISSYTYVMLYCSFLFISFYGLYKWKKNMLLSTK